MLTLEKALEIGQKSDFLMQCQERTGVKFNIPAAKELWEHCIKEMDRIASEVEPHLPEKDLNKGELKEFTPPKVQFKAAKTKEEKERMDGYNLIPSSLAERFFDKIERIVNPVDDSITWIGWYNESQYLLPYYEPVKTKGTMRLKNQDDLKNWLISQGWKPTFWNIKKDKFGKPVRPIERTSPKFHDKGVICPHLELLGEIVEVVKPVVTWLSLRNRRSVIWNPEKNSGWIASERLGQDGRLSAGASGLTNTLRRKHVGVVNVPRVGSVLGEEMRSLFIPEEGNVLVGWDAAGLEARVEAHWCYKYEGGQAYALELTTGDPHSTNARVFYGDDIPVDEDGKVVPVFRNPSKNGKYALTYGCTEERLAETLNIPLEKAKEAFYGFWDTNTALSGFRDALTKQWERTGKKGIKCHLTGYYLHSRSKHSLVNLVFQHTGAIIMDISTLFMDHWLGGIKYTPEGIPHYQYKGFVVKRVLYVHDELQFECPPCIADEIGELGVQSIIKAGQYLKLNVPLDAEYKIGNSWADTH